VDLRNRSCDVSLYGKTSVKVRLKKCKLKSSLKVRMGDRLRIKFSRLNSFFYFREVSALITPLCWVVIRKYVLTVLRKMGTTHLLLVFYFVIN